MSLLLYYHIITMFFALFVFLYKLEKLLLVFNNIFIKILLQILQGPLNLMFLC